MASASIVGLLLLVGTPATAPGIWDWVVTWNLGEGGGEGSPLIDGVNEYWVDCTGVWNEVTNNTTPVLGSSFTFTIKGSASLKTTYIEFIKSGSKLVMQHTCSAGSTIPWPDPPGELGAPGPMGNCNTAVYPTVPGDMTDVADSCSITCSDIGQYPRMRNVPGAIQIAALAHIDCPGDGGTGYLIMHPAGIYACCGSTVTSVANAECFLKGLNAWVVCDA